MITPIVYIIASAVTMYAGFVIIKMGLDFVDSEARSSAWLSVGCGICCCLTAAYASAGAIDALSSYFR